VYCTPLPANIGCVAPQIPASSRSGTEVPLPAAPRTTPDQRLVVEQVHRAFDERRAGTPSRDGERLLDAGPGRHPAHLPDELHVRRDQRVLVDVLQRPAALQRRRRAPPSSTSGDCASCAFLSAVMVW